MSAEADLDFDVLEFCRKLRTSKQPPYTCPIVECGKTYKSMCGLQYHLVIFDHNTMKKAEPAADGVPSTPVQSKPTPAVSTSKKSKKKKRFGKSKLSTPKAVVETPSPKDRRPTADTQNIIEIELDEVIRISVDDKIPIISKHNYEVKYGPMPNFTMELTKSKDLLKLPEPQFSLIDDYSLSAMPEKPLGYIRFIEKSSEDLDGEVEYDMDEEDAAWLNLINNSRRDQSLSPVTVDVFELLMDRLEKESYFQMKTNIQGGDGPAMIDDDAICCICMDGECQNSNVILFCDMCNLAVHQDCYGVPYIPEGQWLCRRCLQSPSRAVDCVLCPNNGGAFKQTDRGHWAHVVCALWIPEVRFANTVFLEPIDSIETIPPARWKLTCYICKQRGVGACIQCHKTNCYSAFHVTCAQSAGLYMKIDAIKDATLETKGRELVQKIAFCNTHCPPNAEDRPKLNVNDNSPRQTNKTSTAPVISIPTIPPEKIQEIGSLVTVAKKNQFIQRLIAYWTLKRQLRNGVPLLRRLQVTHMNKKGDSQNASSRNDDLSELGKQLKYWQHLRQDLERARLLCELVRKREKLKRELTRVKTTSFIMGLCPFNYYLHQLLDLIRSKDTGEIFIEPVDQTEVPDYSDIVKNPMDLSTMREKVDKFEYETLAEFRSDFTLMIDNCLAYNSKETAFYRAAIKMRDQCGPLFKQAEKDLEMLGISSAGEMTDSGPVCDSYDKPDMDISDFDVQLVNLTNDQNPANDEETLEKLNHLMEMTKNIRHSQARTKRVKLIKTLIAKIRRSRTMKEKPAEPENSDDDKAGRASRKRVSEMLKKDVKGRQSPPPAKDLQTSKRRGRPARNGKDSDFVDKNSDSFRKYRSAEVSLKSDEEEASEDGSSCSGCSSRSGSTCDSSDSDSEGGSLASEESSPREKLEQLQLVWAKCRGYPWYPALIINPKMPRGYVHNGVPIPSPPADVIALANNYTEPVYLVLFFDTKRTWQWLPRNKLEPLGVNEELDEMKLLLSRKPTDRKAVRKAYQEAMQHRTQIKPTSPDKN
ncbi:Bromodomain and Hypothetical proteinD finger-containing protein [Nesidiocoris tenuis]|uniref:Peregrin n=1 Tax=Nesidiocoris tenuis TaxID=355587 RepID=A0ABN7B490_9HEMI|nr:Bromodomain and Hypothetical proteinD finger-containing protein [Nesidiocoris tenuis]